MERFAVERFAVERFAVERFAVERFAVERLVVEREAVEREPDALARLVLRAVPEAERGLLAAERDLLAVEREADVPDCVSAARSLSKSLSACLLVLAASRRSARSAAVTSL